jgi:hypothetical protein
MSPAVRLLKLEVCMEMIVKIIYGRLMKLGISGTMELQC